MKVRENYIPVWYVSVKSLSLSLSTSNFNAHFCLSRALGALVVQIDLRNEIAHLLYKVSYNSEEQLLNKSTFYFKNKNKKMYFLIEIVHI